MTLKLGLVNMLAESPVLKRAPNYREVRQLTLDAENAGFDSIWLYDHLLYRHEDNTTIGIWECWTILSALSEATQRIHLGTLVLCNSFRNPAILAKMAATLDEVSQGRFILGIGAGWNKPEYEAFGLRYDHRVSRFDEALQVICPLVRHGQVDYNGKYYRAVNCEIAPRGPSISGVPILIGCEGERMIELTARYADMWNIGYMGKPETFLPYQRKMLEACDRIGRDPATLSMTALIALWYPDLHDEPSFQDQPLVGDDDEILEVIHEYQQLGLSDLMFHLVPFSPESIDRLARIVQRFHS
jgi:alkanesulfonate monooxygenase SsuD/methylene tetrahydromethanopterin reductase-like flavin-dependent oxidoreductase (luciferase family)